MTCKYMFCLYLCVLCVSVEKMSFGKGGLIRPLSGQSSYPKMILDLHSIGTGENLDSSALSSCSVLKPPPMLILQ